ncbi:MAG: 4Fe-4S cluster-binding domain-containing protein [Clostridiales bacterium]|nr:4Fe-4S cluster-binding domain-containing protein [Clostridiales bacterium]
MMILKHDDKRVISILGHSKVDDKQVYRLSTYTYCYSSGPSHLIRSTLTGEVVSLSDAEWSLIGPETAGSVTGSAVIDNQLDDLVHRCILVKADEDDYKRYKLAVSILKTMDKSKKGVHSYTILPTTGCNARCTYCYEEGIKVSTMDEATAAGTVDFIDRTRSEGEIRITWFGGEPLAANKVISGICSGLNERGISFRSEIVTNASLLTPQLMEEAACNWHLDRAQVSVDGVRSDYEARKQFADPAAHNYDTLIDSIGMLLGSGIRTVLRCNYDQGNLEDMISFWEDIYNRYGADENLKIYASMLFQAQKDEECVVLHRRMLELKSEAIRKGFVLLERKEKTPKLKACLCMADSDGKSVVIAPTGELYHCEHLPGNTSFGSIFDGDIVIGSDPRALLEADDRCRKCPFLPECTPFRKHGCPDWFEFCDRVKAVESEYLLEGLISQ